MLVLGIEKDVGLRHRERCLLWNNLSTVANTHNLPWVMAGDFKELLSNYENFGGSPISMSRAISFKECLDVCNMADLKCNLSLTIWVSQVSF